MVKTVAVFLSWLCVYSAATAVAKDGQTEKPGNPAAAIDSLAQEVFTSADRNHNHFLNKSEFVNAQTMLTTAVDNWGRQGLIGKTKKTNKDKDSNNFPASISAGASLDKLSKSNKISQAEFTYFVHSFVEKADASWQQIHAANDAQRKAAAAQRRAMPRHRGVVAPVPFNY